MRYRLSVGSLCALLAVSCDGPDAPLDPSLSSSPEPLVPGALEPISSGVTLSTNKWPNGVVPFQLHDEDFPAFTLAHLEPSTAITGEWIHRSTCEATAIVPATSNFADLEHPVEDMCASIEHLLLAMADWEGTLPGLEFQPQSNLADPSIDFLRIQVGDTLGNDFACSYNVGKASARVRGHIGRQSGINRLRVSPHDGTCDVGGYRHELGHVLGLWHTQGRADRDTWITRDPAQDGSAWFQNIKGPADFEDVGPFDFDSVMLYQSYTSNPSTTHEHFPSAGEFSFDPSTGEAVFDTEALFNGVAFQDAHFGRWGFSVDFLWGTSTADGSTDACFESGVATVTQKMDASTGYLQALDTTTVSGLVERRTGALADHRCYRLVRKGANGHPDFAYSWLDPEVDSDATYGEKQRLTAGDISAVYWQYLTEHDGGTPAAGNAFGSQLAYGDFDNDGVPDLAIGAPGDDGGAGAVYVFKGLFRRSDDSGFIVHEPWIKLPGLPVGALAVGDFNNDQHDDLAVGLPGVGSGEVRVFSREGVYGELQHTTTIRLTDGVDGRGRGLGWPSTVPSAEFGFALAAADLNGDSRDDLVVGAPGSLPQNYDASVHTPGMTLGPWDPMNDATGAAYVFVGTTTPGTMLLTQPSVLDPYSDTNTTGSRSGSRFGSSLAILQRPTATEPDIIVGAPQGYERWLNRGIWETYGNHLGSPPKRTGAIHAFTYNSHPASYDHAWRREDGSQDSEFGAAVAAQGSHLLVGSPAFAEEGGDDTGAAFFYSVLEASGPVDAPDVITGGDVPTTMSTVTGSPCGPMDGDRFGAAVAIGEASEPVGAPWLVIGAPRRNAQCDPSLSAGQGEGEAYLFGASPVGFQARHTGLDVGWEVGAAVAIQPRSERRFEWAGELTTSTFHDGQRETMIGGPGVLVPTTSVTAGVVSGIMDWATTPQGRTLSQR